MWHDSLLYKLKTIGISGDLLSALECFQKNRCQKVVLNGQSLGSTRLYFGTIVVSYVYINDLLIGLESRAKPSADEIFLFSTVHDPVLLASQLQRFLIGHINLK